MPAGFTAHQDLYSAIPTIDVAGWGSYRGLVTGWGEVDGTGDSVCLDVRSGPDIDDDWGYGFRTQRLRHGTNGLDLRSCDDYNSPFDTTCESGRDNDDPCADGYPTYVCLNKDDPGRPMYGEALTLAGWQSQVEWCRLLNLTAASPAGFDAASILMTLWAHPSLPPHPAATACTPATPGPIEVTVTIDSLTASPPPPPPNTGVFGPQFVAALYTDDFGQSVASQSGSTSAHPSLTLCVDPGDTALATVWGWQDLRSTPITGTFDQTEPVLLGTTLAIDPTQGAGTFRETTANLDVTYRVTLDEHSGDEDGLSTCAEAYYHTSDSDVDSDDDELWDDTEIILGTDPNLWDTDLDGVGDWYEIAVYTTDALDPDTDDDCATDGVEIWRGLDPRDPDMDGDGRLDGTEIANGTDPLTPDPPRPLAETCAGFGDDMDGDGLFDTFEDEVALDAKLADSDGDRIDDGFDPDWVKPLVEGLAAETVLLVLLDEAAQKVEGEMYEDALVRILEARDEVGREPKLTPEVVLAAAALDAVARSLASKTGGK